LGLARYGIFAIDFKKGEEMKQKLSAWFPKHIVPVRVGVYQVKESKDYGRKPWYAYWDGKKFGYRALSVDDAFELRWQMTMLPAQCKWRGLASRTGK